MFLGKTKCHYSEMTLTDDMMSYVENTKSNDKLLKLVQWYSMVAGYKLKIQSQFYF